MKRVSENDENNNIQLKTRINDRYSDVTVIFQDTKKKITMHLHRIVLAWQIPYFDSLFSFADNLQEKKFTVQVDDAVIAELLILSFYGQPVDWSASAYQFLQMIKLKSFFCLDIDIHMKDFYQIKVPAEHFTFFLQVVTLPEIEIGRRLLRTIKKNIPADYNWEGVNEEFKQMVLDKNVRNKHIISASRDKTIKLWDLETGACLKTYTGHTKTATSVVLTEPVAGKKFMISASNDKTLKLWDLETETCLKTYAGHAASVVSVVVTEDSQRMISASDDHTLKLWDLTSGAKSEIERLAKSEIERLAVQTYTGHMSAVNSLVLTEDNQHMISASDDKTLKLWDLTTGACLKTYTGHTHNVNSVVLTEPVDGKQQMISASCDTTIKLWDLKTGACLQTYIGHKSSVLSVVLTEDNQQMVSASADKTLKLWDLETGTCLKTYTGHTETVWSVVLTETDDGERQMVSASADDTLKLWDLETGTCLKTYTGHAKGVVSVVLTKDRD